MQWSSCHAKKGKVKGHNLQDFAKKIVDCVSSSAAAAAAAEPMDVVVIGSCVMDFIW